MSINSRGGDEFFQNKRRPPFPGSDDQVVSDTIQLNFARCIYALCGGKLDDPRMSQKVSRIQIAIRDGQSGVMAFKKEWLDDHVEISAQRP